MYANAGGGCRLLALAGGSMHAWRPHAGRSWVDLLAAGVSVSWRLMEIYAPAQSSQRPQLEARRCEGCDDSDGSPEA